MANDRPLAAHEILDALENVSDNEEDYRERLICILPPPVDPDCLTDEDSGEEDNVTLNNLPRNILLQPAEVMIQGQIMVSDTKEEPSDSTGRTKRRRTYAWRKRDLAKNPVNWPDVQGACQDKRPIEWFENFLDEDVISLLVSESNKYAVKKNLPGDITTEDMKCFIGILLVSGYSWLPRRRMYWENSPDTKNELISSAITRDRFDFIFRHLHVNDNLDLQDKYTKVRPLVTLLNKKFLEFSPLEEHYSVDEAMIPYYGRHGCKQHIKGKPIRYEFKAWVGATRLGTTHDNTFIIAKWHDNNIFSIASNAVGINPKQSAKRFSQSEKRNIVIEEPHMVSIYNKYMGGVDRSDENISHYRIGIRGYILFSSNTKVDHAAPVTGTDKFVALKTKNDHHQQPNCGYKPGCRTSQTLEPQPATGTTPVLESMEKQKTNNSRYNEYIFNTL
ncbi:piggyBac transposable element-derived protein 3-like [Galleria mellonella]|uniref:PiggyBac transposable element-derived protein 3-like n=1 Tax=Galleria mellonella TaxID=7137 RepID=A0ABM3MY32_GALME|nr:piggyBac transposable element-derived protein 3-like [Galleria mellonella]